MDSLGAINAGITTGGIGIPPSGGGVGIPPLSNVYDPVSNGKT